MNKISIIFFVCVFFLFSFETNAQNVKLNSSDFYQESQDEKAFYLQYQLSSLNSVKDLDSYKSKSLSFEHVLNIETTPSQDGYLVKVLIEKKAAGESKYICKYFQNLSINELLVDDAKIKTDDFYLYLSTKRAVGEKTRTN